MNCTFRLYRTASASLAIALALSFAAEPSLAAYNAPTATAWSNGTGTLTVTAPTRNVGDVLIVFSAARATTETITDDTGWTRLLNFSGDAGGAAWCRIADNTATDDWSGDWSSTSTGRAIMIRATGGGWTDCS